DTPERVLQSLSLTPCRMESPRRIGSRLARKGSRSSGRLATKRAAFRLPAILLTLVFSPAQESGDLRRMGQRNPALTGCRNHCKAKQPPVRRNARSENPFSTYAQYRRGLGTRNIKNRNLGILCRLVVQDPGSTPEPLDWPPAPGAARRSD